MWLINDRVFLNEGNNNRILKAQDDLSKARQNKALTLVLGNGPSQSAVFLDALANKKEPSDVGWASAIIRAASSAGVPKEYISKEYNLLALAQAIFRQVGNIDASRRMILKELRNEFRRSIGSTPIHKLLIDLAPSHIVTTNYDLQIERAFEEKNKPWCALVGNVQDELPEQLSTIFKMHGTLEPDEKCRDKYRYMNPTWNASPERSVVISETDYDNCLYELMGTSKNVQKSPLFNALRETCLIIGKSMTWQDLSFLYALRETYDARTANPSYILCTSLTKEENLNLHNLKIEPLLINMPSNPKSGHYYVGVVKALIKLFPEIQEAYQDEIENFVYEYDLLRAPHFVAVGLSAHNTTGHMKYAGAGGESKQQNSLPKEGRRNLRFEAEEHAGGSALTTLGIFSALDYRNIYSKSLISVTGKREKDIYGKTEKDIFNETVFEFCKSYDIDIDGVSDTASNTWRSVVVIHDSKTHSGSRYPGQRIFLDQGFKEPLVLSPQTLDQLKAQLNPTQHKLRLVYFDKFLALPYPFDPEDKEKKGPLMEHRDVLRNLASQREDVDILYETGGGGSLALVVEKEFKQDINILTAAFPFFARNVLPEEWRGLGPGMEKFNKDKWWQTKFKDETRAIEELLKKVGCTPEGDYTERFTAPKEWVEGGSKWAAREHPRRWMIVTLHHFGALAVDLSSCEAVYTPCQPIGDVKEEIKSTSGAGDAFRGAFCYKLLECTANHSNHINKGINLLQACTQFAVNMATAKCLKLKLNDALAHLKELSKSTDNISL